MMPLITGTNLGPYQVLSQLGAGGMGEVYLAEDTQKEAFFCFFMNRTDPFLDPIRDDPRFKEAMKKLDPPQ